MKGRYITFVARGETVMKAFDVAKPKTNEILTQNDYTVVSAGTERANLLQHPNTVTYENGFPYHPGYSGAGQVVAVGDNVDSHKIGDRVVVHWGGHQSHTIMKSDSAVKIEDDSIDSIDAALSNIASFSMLGVRKLRLELGESAMIAGQGILGVLALQFASLSGALPVIVSDFDPKRRKLALELGAAAALSPDEDNFVEKAKELTDGQGPNGIVEVTGSAAALQQALEYVAWKGRISLLGCTRVSDASIDFYKYVHRRGVSLIGTNTMARSKQESSPGDWTQLDDFRVFLKLIAAKKIQTRPLISEIVSAQKGPEVFDRLAKNEIAPLGIVLDWSN